MVRRCYRDTINMGSKSKPIEADIYDDIEAAKIVGYALRSINTIHALRNEPRVNVKKGIEVYTARLPQFDEKRRIFSGFIVESPYDADKYALIMDERLTEGEKIAVAFHEISHLGEKGYNSERETQKSAIDSVASLLRSYDDLKKPETVRALKNQKGVDYDISEIPKADLNECLRYMIDSGPYFGIDEQDLTDIGIIDVSSRSRRSRLENLVGMIFLISGIYLILPFNSISGGFIGVGGISMELFSLLGIFLISCSLTIFSYRKLFFRKTKSLKN